VKLAWSNLAKAELKELRRFSIERWGREVAQRYLEDLQAAAQRLCLDPHSARPLVGSFRACRVRSHYLIVYEDTAANRLTIARILHVTMDIDRHLP